MGLTAFEYQCGRGVRCGEETALKIGAAAEQHSIQMSIHAPYFINLSSEEERAHGGKNVGYVAGDRAAGRAGLAQRAWSCTAAVRAS